MVSGIINESTTHSVFFIQMWKNAQVQAICYFSLQVTAQQLLKHHYYPNSKTCLSMKENLIHRKKMTGFEVSFWQ